MEWSELEETISFAKEKLMEKNAKREVLLQEKTDYENEWYQLDQ